MFISGANRCGAAKISIADTRILIANYSHEYRLKLLYRYSEYLQRIYANLEKQQSNLLEEFKDAPGAYFDIDQKKINLILKPAPKKFGQKSEKLEKTEETGLENAAEKQKEEMKNAPIILLNSKKLTKLQMERFPHNDFFEKYENNEISGVSKNIVNPDIEKLNELKLLINKEVFFFL